MNQATTKPTSDAALAQLRRQRDLYVRLQSLAEKQRSMLADDDTRPLLNVLAQRQQLMQELTQLSIQMTLLRRDFADLKASWKAAERTEAERLVAEVDSRLKSLLAGDEEDAKHLRLRQQSVQSSLTASRGQAQALAAYRSAGSNQPTARFEETHGSA
jgi:hypothetical protein